MQGRKGSGFLKCLTGMLFCTCALFAHGDEELAASGWARLDSAHFSVYTRQDPESVKPMLRDLEDFRRVVLLLTAIKPEGNTPSLPIFMMPGLEELKFLSGQDCNNVWGVYRTGFGGERAAVTKGWGDEEYIRRGLFFEYTIEVGNYNSRVLYPLWYRVGLAEYFSQVGFSPDSIVIGLPYTNALKSLKNEEWTPYAQLMQVKAGTTGGWMDTFYPQSWLAVHYFMSDPERKTWLLQYLQRYQESGDYRAAYAEKLAPHFPDLSYAIGAYFMRAHYPYMKMERDKSAAAEAVQVTPLSETDVLLAMGRTSANVTGNADACRSLFGRLLKQDAGNLDARAGLAYCESRAGDFSHVDPAPLPAEASVQARLWQAHAQLLQAQSLRKANASADISKLMESANAQVVGVIRQDKRSGGAIVLLAQIYAIRGDVASAARLYHAAQSYSPYDQELYLDEADMQVKLAAWDQAAALLDRVLQGADDQETLSRARALKADLDRLQAGGSVPRAGI